MMPATIDGVAAPAGRGRTTSLLRTARIALYVAGAAALYRVVIALMSHLIDRPTKVQLLLVYGTIAVVAVALRWGIDRRAPVARWACVGAGLLMAAALIRGRGGFATLWHYFPMPAFDVLLFLVWPLMVSGFVVAALCCAVAQSDTAGWQ
jgi:hypothetical protein